ASVELAFGDTSKAFVDDVLGSYTAPGDRNPKTKTVQPPGRSPLTFQAYELNDGQYIYYIYLWRGNDKQIAVAYWVLAASRSNTPAQTIDSSLQSSAPDGEASRQKAAYEKMRYLPLKPPDHPG